MMLLAKKNFEYAKDELQSIYNECKECPSLCAGCPLYNRSIALEAHFEAWTEYYNE